jgi:hypothetical protein
MHFLYGPNKIPITIMLNFNKFYVSATAGFPPEFALHFSSPEYKHLSDFMFCSSILTIPYSKQRTSFPVRNCK